MAGPASVRRAAWAGLTDSAPRAAVLQLHARVAGTTPSALDSPELVQVWGPRFSTYAVPSQDHAVFTVGRTPVDEARRRRAADLADALEAFLDGRELPLGEPARAMGAHPSMLRYATTTGRVLIRWDGARQPTVRVIPAPAMPVDDARLELARRYLHVLGPGTPEGLGDWAGLRAATYRLAFEALLPELTPVRTDTCDAWVLTSDVEDLQRAPGRAAPARLLPSGDAFYLFQGTDRELVVPDESQRTRLWTSRVWPGAVLVDGEIRGTWRRAEHRLTIHAWGALSARQRGAVEAEARSLPLPAPRTPLTPTWET
nr:crosslink repair DNA glycosylase YcaQ family protein [Cellulomonas sp. APG4]